MSTERRTTGLSEPYPDNSDGGLLRTLQAADAAIALKQLDDSEADHQAQLTQLAAIRDAVDRIEAHGRYNVAHLLEFGVVADDRDALRDELVSLRITGDQSVREVSKSLRRRRRESKSC